MARTPDQALTYLRRSTEKQEISLPNQLEWANATARKYGVTLDASSADLAHMQTSRLHSFKAIRLDDGISGADLTRPGFLAFNRDALADKRKSHVFIYKRDRYARPTDAMQAAMCEKKLSEAGITIAFSDAVSLPLRYGTQNIMRDLELLLGYYQGGEELLKLADRVLGFQKVLAEGGYRTGGNAPYGFVRVLVDSTGTILEELPPGKTVRQPGCHVRVIPKDPEKIANWLRILTWKEQSGWGIKRIAKQLNDEGIPSPDAGRTRTDHGARHKVTGRWSPNTVAELCRNAVIIGVQDYGKRSEGKLRRLGPEGSRLLEEEKDLAPNGKLKIIMNDASLRIRKTVGEAQCDPKQWEAIQQQMDVRGRNQRGLPRAKDPARYPLACRLVDLTEGCGSFLYGRTNQGRAMYTCGRYMRTASAECASNQVDGEAILRFTLKTLKQLVDRHGNRAKLHEKLLARALQASSEPLANPGAAELARLQSRQGELREQVATIEYRMARERNDSLYEALSRQFSTARAELSAAEDALRRREAENASVQAESPEAQAGAALGLLDEVTRVTTAPKARAEVNALLIRLGVYIGLQFESAIKGKKRVVQRLLSGRMVFGNAALPVPLFGKDNVDDHPHSCGKTPAPKAGTEDQREQGPHPVDLELDAFSASDVDFQNSRENTQTAETGVFPVSAAAVGGRSPNRLENRQSEGISTTKVSRGERI
jgi:hypothetical protein